MTIDIIYLMLSPVYEIFRYKIIKLNKDRSKYLIKALKTKQFHCSF